MPSGTLTIEDCLDCCDECPDDGDWELTANDADACPECRVTVNPVIFYQVDDPSPVIDVFTIPVSAGLTPTSLVDVLMQQYEDECVTLEDEVDAQVTATITCADGMLHVSISVEIPGSLEPTSVEVFNGDGAIGAVITNTLDCSSGQLPFVITSVVVQHIPPP